MKHKTPYFVSTIQIESLTQFENIITTIKETVLSNFYETLNSLASVLIMTDNIP